MRIKILFFLIIFTIVFAHGVYSAAPHQPLLPLTLDEVVDQLAEGMDEDNDSRVFRAVSNVDPVNYQVFTNKVNELCWGIDRLNDREKVWIIEAVSKVDPVNYQAFTYMINNLSRGMNGRGKAFIIESLGDVEPENYQSFTYMIYNLSRGMNQENKCDLLDNFTVVDPADYAIALVLGCSIPNAQERFIALHRFVNVVSEQRTLRAARALLFCRWIANNEQKGQRIMLVLESALDALIPPIGAEFVGPNPYKAGVNVHAGDRDKKTQQAYDLLLSLWNPTPEEVEHYSNALIHHVEASGNAKAIRALTGRERTTNDFGALLQSTEKEFVKTRLAHLWHFATEAVNAIGHSEMELAKGSIVAALADAVEGGHLVCNPGKYQRLATSLLQGRLQGVKIDTTPIPADAKLVPVAAEVLANVLRKEAAAAPAPERIQVIRNVDAIEEYLKPLTDGWMRMPPANGAILLRQTFNYILTLGHGRVPGADGRRIFLDPRDVVFHLLFGKGVTREGGTLSNTLLVDELNVDDYIAQYQNREQAAYREAKAEADRKTLMEAQDAAFERAQATERAKQKAEESPAAEAIRIKEEAAAKMAEEETSRREAQQQRELERKRLESLTPQQRRTLIADSYDKIAQRVAGSADDIDVIMRDVSAENITATAVPAPAPITQAALSAAITEPAAVYQEFAQDKRGTKRLTTPSQPALQQPGKLARTGSIG